MNSLHETFMRFTKEFFTGEYEEYVGKSMPVFAFGLILFLVAPWAAMMIYGLFYGIFQRPGEMKAMALSPFMTFFFFLTDPATPGFDQRLMRMFHPSLLEEKKDGGSAQRGLIRAMSRCLIDQFGPITNIPRDTVVIKKDGNDVNCMALVDFAKVKQVRCQLSWRKRSSVVKKYKAATGRYPERAGKEATIINGIGMAFPYTFQVTSFHVDPKPGDAFNILEYLNLMDFEDFGALFAERLFQQPPLDAVTMMVEALRAKYAEEKVSVLQENVQRVVDACGGLAGPLAELTADQSSNRAVYSTATPEEEAAGTTTKDGKSRRAIDGVDMEYLVKGKSRDAEVYVRLTFSGLRAMVARYEVRVLGDARSQVIVDPEANSTEVVA